MDNSKKEELYPMVFGFGDVGVKLKRLTNEELARKLLDEVWSDMEVFSGKSAIVAEAVERLRKMEGA